MNNKIQIGQGINTSFSLINTSMGPFLLMGLIFFGIGLVTGLFGMIPLLGILVGIGMGVLIFPPLECGLFYAAKKAHDTEEEVEVGDLFKGFDYFAPAVVIMILVGIFEFFAAIPGAVLFVPGIIMVSADEVVGLGIFLIVIGGFISLIGVLLVATIYVYAFAFVVDKNCSFWEAMEGSRKLVWANFWGSLGTFLLTQVMELIGVLLCGIGVIYTTPLQKCFVYSVYRTGVPPEKKRTTKKTTKPPAPKK